MKKTLLLLTALAGLTIIAHAEAPPSYWGYTFQLQAGIQYMWENFAPMG